MPLFCWGSSEVPCNSIALSDYTGSQKIIMQCMQKMSMQTYHSQCDSWVNINLVLLYSVRLAEITFLSKGTGQLQSCYDATGCGGNQVTFVSTARNCCLGRGLSFRDGSGICRQCIGKQLCVRYTWYAVPI